MTRDVPLTSIALLAVVGATQGCKSVESFSSKRDHYEGDIVQGSFVRAGFQATTRACLVLDAEHLADAPGRFTTSDGRFRDAPLRPIPQLFHDPLSTMSFGDGRLKNLMYGANGEVADAREATVILSLLQSDDVEVRVIRGAPIEDAGAIPPIFGVFQLKRAKGSCSF